MFASTVLVSILVAATPSDSRVPRPLDPSVLFGRVSPSVLVVRAKVSDGESQGSAVVVGPDKVITNLHVVKGASEITVGHGALTWTAKLVRLNEKQDLALLEVKELRRPAAVLRSSNSLKVGERVFTVGAPHGLELTMSDGLISSLRESGKASLIQTSAPISPGSSGGGLFDAQGRLIGITTFTRGGQNLNFAHPAEWVQALLLGVDSPDAAVVDAEPTWSISNKPEALACRFFSLSQWGLFSEGTEILSTEPIEEEAWVFDVKTQTPRVRAPGAETDTLVLDDMSRTHQVMVFTSTSRADRAWFLTFDGTKVKLMKATATSLRGKPRLMVTSGECEAKPQSEVLAMANAHRAPKLSADAKRDEACSNGRAEVCLALARGSRGGIAANYNRRACEHGSALGCREAAEAYELVGEKARAARFREMGAALEAGDIGVRPKSSDGAAKAPPSTTVPSSGRKPLQPPK